VLLKAAEKRLVRTGNVDDIVESLGAKNVHTLLPAPSTMIKVLGSSDMMMSVAQYTETCTAVDRCPCYLPDQGNCC